MGGDHLWIAFFFRSANPGAAISRSIWICRASPKRRFISMDCLSALAKSHGQGSTIVLALPASLLRLARLAYELFTLVPQKEK
jgi:hypothetical protein